MALFEESDDHTVGVSEKTFLHYVKDIAAYMQIVAIETYHEWRNEPMPKTNACDMDDLHSFLTRERKRIEDIDIAEVKKEYIDKLIRDVPIDVLEIVKESVEENYYKNSQYQGYAILTTALTKGLEGIISRKRNI